MILGEYLDFDENSCLS